MDHSSAETPTVSTTGPERREAFSPESEELDPAIQPVDSEAAMVTPEPLDDTPISASEILDRGEHPIDMATAAPVPAFKMGDLIQPGEGVIPPAVLDLATPEYPRIAKRLGLEGLIQASVLVDENGKVAEVRFDKGHQGFRDSIKKTLSKAKFKPATKDGIQGKMWIGLAFNFEL